MAQSQSTQYQPGAEIGVRPQPTEEPPSPKRGIVEVVQMARAEEARVARRNQKKAARQARQQAAIAEQRAGKSSNKLSGFGFTMMAVVAFIKDSAELVFAFGGIVLVSSGTALLAGGATAELTGSAAVGGIVGALVKALEFTGVGTVLINTVDLGLATIFSFSGFLFSLFLYFSILTYLIFQGVSFTTRRLVVIASSFIIGIVPLFNLLPETVFMLFFLRHIEKKQSAEKAATAASQPTTA